MNYGSMHQFSSGWAHLVNNQLKSRVFNTVKHALFKEGKKVICITIEVSL